MRFATALSTLALAALAAAQDQTVEVIVGGNATSDGGVFQFIPSTITATNNSVITFVFSGAPGNHTITQSSFTDPCAPLSGGFSSGYIFIPPGTTDGFPTWNLTVENDQTPIWFYCAQTIPSPHCFSGMVGAINPPTTGNRTFSAFQAAATSLAASSFSGSATAPALSGVGAVATAAPGPLTASGVSGALLPSASGSGSESVSGSGSETAPAPSSTDSGAITIVANSIAVLFAAVAGAVLL